MQPTPVSSMASNIPPPTLKHSYFKQQSYREQNDLTIEYSGQDGDLFLQMSTGISHSSTIYSEKGYLPSKSPAPQLSSPAIEDIDSTASGAITGQLFEMVLQKYYELILERVAYLLGEMSNNQVGLTFVPAENQQDATQIGHSTHATLVYSESLSVSRSLTIGGTITDQNYFSAEKTADRIISFALSFYDGGDREEYAEMARSAVMKGFDQAMAALGGYLPEVSYNTIDMINRAIDEFAAVGKIDINI